MTTTQGLKRIVPAIVLLLAGFATASAQTLSSQGTSEIDSILRGATENGVAPGIVAMVVSKDQILYHNAFGMRDVGASKPMQKDSIFRIASMTKPVTSAAIMLLIEEGKLRLDDPVSKYIPGFANRETIASFNESDGSFTTRKAAGEVRIRHLLTNTSGLAYGFSNAAVPRLQQRTMLPAEELPLLYDPGTKWTYSGSTRILGQILEKVTGASLDRFMSERFFGPLGMQDTFYAVPSSKTDRVVTTHRRTDGALAESANPANIASPVAGDGGLNSTAGDYARFLQMLLNKGKWQGKAILREQSVEAMTRSQIGSVVVDTQPAVQPNLARPFPVGPSAGRDKFGFGFQITASNRENTDLRSPGSYTWAGIYNTHFWVDPRREIAGVLLMQVLPFYDDGIMKVYEDFEAAIGRNLR